MPRGTYSLLDPHGDVVGVEAFSCAPGPAGWRYVSTVTDPDAPDVVLSRVDVTVDDAWRQVRVAVHAGGWAVRAGCIGTDVVWTRAPEVDAAAVGVDVVEESARAAALVGDSPAFLVATARLLALEEGQRKRLDVVRVTGLSCAVTVGAMGWALVGVEDHEAEAGVLRVERYEVADLNTGERCVVHLAGDVVVGADSVELLELESPPNTVG